MARSFIESLWLPLRVINEHNHGDNYMRLVDDRGGHVAYIHTMIIPEKQTAQCLRQFIFNIKTRSYLATSAMQIGIEKIYKVETHPYIKTGENIHHFRTTIGKPTRARTRNKARMKAGCLPRMSHIAYSEEEYNDDSTYKQIRRQLKVRGNRNILETEKRKLQTIAKKDQKIAAYLESLAERKLMESKQDGVDTSLPDQDLPDSNDKGYYDGKGRYQETT